MFLLGCYLSKHFRDRRWGWVWVWWLTIEFKNRMAFVRYTVHMNCNVHYNCCMAVKQWIQIFYTHPTFFTELGSPWLEYTPADLGPFDGGISPVRGKSSANVKHVKWFCFFFLTHSYSHTWALGARTHARTHSHPLPKSVHLWPTYSKTTKKDK